LTGWPLFIGVTRLEELAGPEADWLLADFQVGE
jgi:hypothetical protein